MAACEESASPPPPAPAATSTAQPGGPAGGEAQAELPDSYTVRGVIVALPESGEAMRVRHEAIPDFRGRNSEVVGMDAMTMPFPLGDDVELGDLAVGDKVELTFVVTWTGEKPWHVTEIGRLDPATELDLPQAGMSD